MKILHVHDKPFDLPANRTDAPGLTEDGGGVGIYLRQVAHGLRGRGCKIASVRLAADGADEQPVVNGQHRVRAFRYFYRRQSVAAFERIIRDERPDIVHLHSVFEGMHPLMLRRAARVARVVCTFHDVGPTCFWHTRIRPDGSLCTTPVGLRCVGSGCYRIGAMERATGDVARLLGHRFYLRMYQRLPVIVPSRYMHGLFVANGFRQDRLRVLPLFTRFEPEPSEAAPSDPPTILHVGRIEPEKGVVTMIDALALMADRSWRAVIVGKGTDLERAKGAARESGIEDRIEFVGHCNPDELAARYRSSSFAVIPSLVAESFGLVGVEAMSFARAVIAFRSGGVTEWLDDGANGFLARHGDTAHLALLMRRLLDDPALCRRLGTAGAAMVSARFTLDHHLDALVALYEAQTGDGARR